MNKKPKSDYAIQTVVNALRLLEAFQDEDELGVTELSRRLALHKNNVFRLLATLEQQGYVEQSPHSERYRLGLQSLELGKAFSRSRTLLRRSRHILEQLSALTEETTHLAMLDQFTVAHVDAVVPDRLVVTGSRVGRSLPVHATALGKVLLGCASESVREKFDKTVVADRPLTQRTAQTIVDPHKLFDHLRGVAVRGFALDIEECEEGLRCAAAPIFDADGSVAGALSVSGPAFRLSEGHLLSEIAPAVVQVADALSRELGSEVSIRS